MENNSTQGIFYMVIGIATLAAAIIGATYAFFSASANSANDAIGTSGAAVSLGYVDVKTGMKNDLIPVNDSLPRFPDVVGIESNDCKDDNSNNICSVYQYTISNPNTNTAAQTVYAKLNIMTNTFGDLYFAIFKGAATSISSFDVNASATATSSASVGSVVVPKTLITGTGTSINMTNLTETLAIGSSSTYTVVVWLLDTGANQVIADAGQSFTAGIAYTTDNGTSGVTGVISTS